MLTRRVLTILPIAVIVVLIQSAFWVPTYDRQDLAGAARLRTFIQSTIGDAKFTNPVISTDAVAPAKLSRHRERSLPPPASLP